jgi:hypothetical protein
MNLSEMLPELALLIESDPTILADHKIGNSSGSRIYDVTVYLTNGEVLETYTNISAQEAGRIRNRNRKLGNRVNQIEVSNLSGTITRYEFIPPEQHSSQIDESAKPLVPIKKYNARTAKANAKFQDNFFSKANSHLMKVSQNTIHILVYEKISGNLCFSGELEDAARFVWNKMQSGEWNETSWVIYLPKKIYDRMG